MPAPRVGGLIEEGLSHSVIGAFFDVHHELGFGYREYIYALALEDESGSMLQNSVNGRVQKRRHRPA